jgi:glutathione synthase/RimK-type ligase-like ATP-grasp enzyme
LSDVIPLEPSWERICVPRLGVAALTRQAFQGVDLFPLWTQMMDRVTDDTAGSGMGMDLSVIAQLRGDKPTGLAIQNEALQLHQIFCPDRNPTAPSLRVLAFAAASDIGANTPIEFLLEGSDISLAVLYLGPGIPLPRALPAHDIAMVIAPASQDGEDALAMAEELMRGHGAPLLNHPAHIRHLERDQLYLKLKDIAGLKIPPTLRITRTELEQSASVPSPIIIRPFGSHAGFGLAKIDDVAALRTYLETRPEEGFFVSPFIDYASRDRMFRKYRIALIDGKAFAVHMAIADEWKVWYLNADMALSPSNRLEEARFMQYFDETFATRHAQALGAMSAAIGLDYVLVDCAETRDGELLIFEADHCAIVHDMDPVNVYPYKPAQMHKIYAAFADMLKRRAMKADCRAA